MRKPALLAVVAAMGLIAAFSTSAMADPVEVEDRASGNMCDDTPAGDCELHFISNDKSLIVHTFLGSLSYNCSWELVIELDSNGQATSAQVEIEDGTNNNCNEDIIPCEEPWTSSMSHDGAGVESMTTNLCIDPPLIGTCEGDIHATLSKTGPDYSIEYVDVEIEGVSACEFYGDWVLEDPDGIEIHHV